MPTKTGVVSNIKANKGTSKAGKPYTIYVAEIDGEDFSCGFTKPTFNTGDTITFDWEKKFGKNEIVAGTASKSAGGAPAPTGQRSTGYSGASGKVFPVPANHGDRSIIRQNAVTNAREIVKQYDDGVYSPTLEDVQPLSLEQYTARVIEVAQLIEAYTSGDLGASAVPSNGDFGD